MFKKIFIIINPISGKPEPVLHTIIHALKKTDIVWDVGVTQPDNMDKLIKRADEFQAEAIAVYGGDGTVSAVAKENISSGRPMFILPGGTANVLSLDLGIPQELKNACALLTQKDPHIRKIDLATINDKCFFTRISWGIEAQMIQNASREMKEKFGNAAYFISAVKSLFTSQKLKFTIEVDGKKIEESGFACIVANSGHIGVGNQSLHPVKIDDGLLDIFLFREGNVESLISTAANVLSHTHVEGLGHWQGQHIEISSSPRETVQCDGEILGKEDAIIAVEKQAAQFIVP